VLLEAGECAGRAEYLVTVSREVARRDAALGLDVGDTSDSL